MKIFLIGMMGSGKTYWMDRLSRKLRLQRYDLDRLIEDVEDRSVAQVFKESGESHFRQMESIVLKWFDDKDDFILATGGGTPCYNGNMEWMNKQGLTIWLDEDSGVMAERLLPEKDKRPLLAAIPGNKLQDFLEQKKQEREEFYSQAKFRLIGSEINEKNLLNIIKDYIHA